MCKIITLLIFVFGLFVLIWFLAAVFKKRIKESGYQELAIFITIAFILSLLVYSFGICWFSEWMYSGDLDSDEIYLLTFYNLGNIPMIYLALLFGCALFLSL